MDKAAKPANDLQSFWSKNVIKILQRIASNNPRYHQENVSFIFWRPNGDLMILCPSEFSILW